MHPGACRFHHCRPQPSSRGCRLRPFLQGPGPRQREPCSRKPSPHLTDCGAGHGLGGPSPPRPPLWLTSVVCLVLTVSLKPGVPEGLHDPGVPPHHPALPGGNTTTAVTGSGAVALSPQPRAVITSSYCTPPSRGPPQAPWGRREGRSPAGWRINLPWQAPLRAGIFCRCPAPSCGLWVTPSLWLSWAGR